MKGREEKGKKRVIHLYAGKDNQLAILTRSTFRGEEKNKKRREEQEAGDPPVRRKGQQTHYLAEEQEAGDPPVRGKGQQTCYLAEVDNQKRREEKRRWNAGVIHR